MIHAEASAIINERPEDVYAVIRNYHTDHPAIVPKPYFQDITVEKGGIGAGTIILTKMRAFGQDVTYRLHVTEPEPGRVIMEADAEAGVTTHFIVDPVNGGSQSRVTIITEIASKPGMMGLVERLINPPAMRFVFKKELAQLASYMASKKKAS